MFSKSWFPVLLSLGILFSLNMLMISSLAPSQLGKQFIAWLLGAILFLVGRQINPKQISSSKWAIFIGSCILLLLPILLNNITRGSRRWIDIGFTTLQPSELVKPWLLLFLSSTNLPLLHFIPVFIIMLQPDLGSAISTLILMTPVVLFNKKLLKLALISGIIFLASTPLLYKYALHDYQRDRIVNFLNPQHDPLGKGYNVIQSKIAIGSGSIFGKGYKKGTQGQLLFLPEKHTDFMFAATSEELGLFGVLIILFAYYLLIKTLFQKAYSHPNNPQLFIFTLGIAILIWSQAFINIGMNLGILPVTGIPLPFLSLGGSSLMTLLFSLGIVFSA